MPKYSWCGIVVTWHIHILKGLVRWHTWHPLHCWKTFKTNFWMSYPDYERRHSSSFHLCMYNFKLSSLLFILIYKLADKTISFHVKIKSMQYEIFIANFVPLVHVRNIPQIALSLSFLWCFWMQILWHRIWMAQLDHTSLALNIMIKAIWFDLIWSDLIRSDLIWSASCIVCEH